MLNLRNRSFLKEIDFTAPELRFLLELAAALEVAAYDEGAHVTYLDPSGSQIGHKESVADTARVLGRMYDAIEFRGNRQDDVEQLAEHAGVPVYNGLTDEWHPTQSLADVLTMCEHSRKPDEAISLAFLGDTRNNVARSLLVTGALLGSEVRLVGPGALWPPDDVVGVAKELAAQSGARLSLTDDVEGGVEHVDFVYTDVWVSMGEPPEVWDRRVQLLRPYQVNADLMKRTLNPKARFMHCLPAFHDDKTVVGKQVMDRYGMAGGLEVTDDVFESTASLVFDQAENRLHTIKAILVATLGS